MNPTQLALVCDYPEEGWPSMDLVGEMIQTHLSLEHADQIAVSRVCPPYRHRVGRWPLIQKSGLARNADRLLNRFWDYPHALRPRSKRGEFDLFHLVDHSYSQLVHVLPKNRTIVTCHDLDTFRCLLDPVREPRPYWFRALAQRTLKGMQSAAMVVCDSKATMNALLEHDLVPEARLRVVYLGTHPECSIESDPAADEAATRRLGPRDPQGPPEIVHVGSTIPRKRIDVLIATFASIRQAYPGARLIRAGGAFTADQEQQARELGVSDAIVTLPFCSRSILAAVYRRASLVLLPSEAEGFGLPVAEALACGAPLLASDLSVLREVGGESPVYCPVGDVPAWSEAARLLLMEQPGSADWQARRERGLDTAQRFVWSQHVAQLVEIYDEVLGRVSHNP